jgi:hypothetical protein
MTKIQDRTVTTQLEVRPRSYAQVTASVPAALLAAKYVYVRRDGHKPPLSPLYEGPFAVLRSGDKHYEIQMGGRKETVSIDRLKPHLGDAAIMPAEPARRGRPPLARAALAPEAQ